MNLKELKELLELLLEKDVTEFELEENGVKLKIKKGQPAHRPASSNHPPDPAASVAVSEAAKSSPAPDTGQAHEDDGVRVVRSPMVGTFYHAPDPNAAPFVSVGDRVEVGQVLCIIEAMKLMNEIESEEAGEVVRVFVENGQPVQYGDELFAVRVEG